MADVKLEPTHILHWMQHYAALIEEHKDYLTALDAAIGDADHGVNMHRGLQAVCTRLETQPEADIASACKAIGMTLVSTVGGASGPLYGSFFLQVAKASSDGSWPLRTFATALQQGADAVAGRGKAQPGDKTMLDSLIPATAALQQAAEQGQPWPQALQQAAEAAHSGMEATTALLARKGRASYLGERSVGHQDPGATSVQLLFHAAHEVWSDRLA